MQILLRRASTLARACGERAKALLDEVQANSTIEFSAHRDENVPARLEAESAKLVQKARDALELYRTEARIRAIAGKANAEGINTNLAFRDHYLSPAERGLKDIMERLRLDDDFDRVDSPHDADEIKARVAGVRQRLQTVTSGVIKDSISAPALSPADAKQLERLLAEIRQSKIVNSEEIARGNLTLYVQFPDDVMTILREHLIVID